MGEAFYLSDMRIFPVAQLAAKGKWRTEAMRTLSEPFFLWFTKGTGRITIGGSTANYSMHNAFFIPAGTMHGFDLNPDVYGTALFMGRNCQTILPQQPLQLRVRTGLFQTELRFLLENIQREIFSANLASERAASAYVDLLSIFIQRQALHSKVAQSSPKSSCQIVDAFTKLIENEFRNGVNVTVLAKKLGITPTHLTRSCNITCGKSALQILQDRKLFEACTMLTETQVPVSDISKSLGFISPAYFSRAFTQKTGKNPSLFRKLS
ncbi:MAG: AraC family transcriptional activator of pobA [Paracoccaceae bacterium]|jgi:AraC family transcriptional activator of pobA